MTTLKLGWNAPGNATLFAPLVGRAPGLKLWPGRYGGGHLTALVTSVPAPPAPAPLYSTKLYD